MKKAIHILGTSPGIQNFLDYADQLDEPPECIGCTDIARFYPEIKNLVILNDPGQAIDGGKTLKLSEDRFSFERISAIHNNGKFYDRFYAIDPTLWMHPFKNIIDNNFAYHNIHQIVNTEEVKILKPHFAPRGLLYNEEYTWVSNNSPFVAAVLAFKFIYPKMKPDINYEIVLWGVDLNHHRFLKRPANRRQAIDDFENLRDMLEMEGVKLLLGYKGTIPNALDGTLDIWEI